MPLGLCCWLCHLCKSCSARRLYNCETQLLLVMIPFFIPFCLTIFMMPFVWGHGAKNCCLQSVGHFMLSDSSVVPIMEVDAIIEALCEQLQGTHSHALQCPRAAPSAGVVSCAYHQWFRPFGKHRRFCQLPVSGKRRQHFLQFRLGSHNLPVVAGRFCGIARADKYVRSVQTVKTCGGIAVADELHIVVHEYPVLQPLRQQYAALFTSNTDTMRSFFAQ